MFHPQLYLEFLEALILLSDRYTIHFRPHPVERSRLTEIYGDFFANNMNKIDIDPYKQALESIFNADAVIGESSAVLFEAHTFDEPKVFVLGTPSTVDNLGPDIRLLGKRVDTPKDLIHELNNLKTIERKTVANSKFWQSNWKSNWSEYLDKHGISQTNKS